MGARQFYRRHPEDSLGRISLDARPPILAGAFAVVVSSRPASAPFSELTRVSHTLRGAARAGAPHLHLPAADSSG
jgi:hypothetical protein